MLLFVFTKENSELTKENYTDSYSLSPNLIIYQIKFNYLSNSLSLSLSIPIRKIIGLTHPINQTHSLVF